MTRAKFLKEKGTSYSDWFDQGDIIEDFNNVEKNRKEKAISVLRKDFVILIEFKDEFVVSGYDSSEYQISFSFKK